MNVSRRRYMGEKGGGIPYPIVGFLQAQILCRINPNVTGNARILGKAVSIQQSSGSQVLICSTSQGRAGTYFGEPSSTDNWGFGAAEGAYVNVPIITPAEFDLEFYSGGVSGNINGQTASRTSSYENSAWSVFSTSGSSYPFLGNIYWFKFYQNDVLVRDLVPCRISRTGYLYDKVSGQLFGNDTVYQLLIGPDKNCVNLANYSPENVSIGYYVNGTTGGFVQDNRNFCSDFIPIEPNFDYYAAGTSKQNQTFARYNRIAWYDENKVFISQSSANNAPNIDTSPLNARFAIFNCNINGDDVTQSLIDSYDWFLNKMI